MPRKSTIPPQKRITDGMPTVRVGDVAPATPHAEPPPPPVDLAGIDAKLDGTNNRIDTLVELIREWRGALEKRLDDHESRIRALEERSKGQ